MMQIKPVIGLKKQVWVADVRIVHWNKEAIICRDSYGHDHKAQHQQANQHH